MTYLLCRPGLRQKWKLDIDCIQASKSPILCPLGLWHFLQTSVPNSLLLPYFPPFLNGRRDQVSLIYMQIQMSQSGCYHFFNCERKSLILLKKIPKATGDWADFEGSGFLIQTLCKADPPLKRILRREEAYSLLNSPLHRKNMVSRWTEYFGSALPLNTMWSWIKHSTTLGLILLFLSLRFSYSIKCSLKKNTLLGDVVRIEYL